MSLIASGSATAVSGIASVTLNVSNAAFIAIFTSALAAPRTGIVSAPSDTSHNTWTEVSPSSTPQCALFFCVNPITTSAQTFSITGVGGEPQLVIVVLAFSDRFSALDGQSTSTLPYPAGSVSIQPGSITPSVPGDLFISALFGYVASNRPNAHAWNTAVTFINLGETIGAAYLIDAGSSPENPTWSFLSLSGGGVAFTIQAAFLLNTSLISPCTPISALHQSYSAPYKDVTLTQFINQISSLMDDTGQQYWTASEIQAATYEALLYWGALTGYWRTRATFNACQFTQPFQGIAWVPPYVDLSAQFPLLRSRSYTLGQLVKEIQSSLLEAANGVSGVGMSGQVTVTAIIDAVQEACNLFILDAALPMSYHWPIANTSQSGIITLPDTSVNVHRLSWQGADGQWTPLWRQDAWALDNSSPQWTVESGIPTSYSESELAPLMLQLVPPPLGSGTIEAFTSDSVTLVVADSTSLGLPDEWVHAVKYKALAILLSSASQLNDPLRSQYCQKRYEQYVAFAQNAISVLRVLVNNVPMPLDSLSSYDAANPYWMNTFGSPVAAVCMYDWVALVPAQLDQLYGVAVDLTPSAPLPSMAGFMPVGREDLSNIERYVRHILTFKCGGKEFTSTIPEYDSYMRAVDGRKRINKAKIQYLEPLFGAVNRDDQMRPDQMEEKSSA